MAARIRTGIGFDVHALKEGRKLVLGGVEVPFDKGLNGWSDADVLTHAVIDALLGAAALGDIGSYFPPGDLQFKDISSMILLERTRDRLAKNGYKIQNIDATIVAEEPKLKGYIPVMRRRLSRTLMIDINLVSVKASTSDRLGFTGRGEGIAAYAVVLIEGGEDEGI